MPPTLSTLRENLPKPIVVAAAVGGLGYVSALIFIRQKKVHEKTEKLLSLNKDMEGKKPSPVLLYGVAPVLMMLDFAIWGLSVVGPVKYIMHHVQKPSRYAVASEDRDGKVFRNVLAKNELKATIRNHTTLYESVLKACELYPERHAMGYRMLKAIEEPKPPSRFPTRVFDDEKWVTYKELEQVLHTAGMGLRACGLEPLPHGLSYEKAKGKHTMLIWEDSCMEWMVTALGAMSQSVVVATCYATLGPDAVVSAVQEAGISLILCNVESVEGVLKRAKEMPTLTHIVYTYHNTVPEKRKPPQTSSSIKLISFDQLLKMGKEKKFRPTPPDEDTVAVLMYTSGSTGKPKGVMARHRNLLAMVASVYTIVPQFQTQQKHLLGYLPLAHILEMAVEAYAFSTGKTVCYADPKCLVAGPGTCKEPGALELFRPNLLAGVPKVWEGFKSKAESKIAAGGVGKATLFSAALAWKEVAMPSGRITPLFDLILFNRFKGILGGRLELGLSGGGAISPAVQSWIRSVFGCPVVQGYGLTETCGGLTIQLPSDWRVGVVGAPLPCCEVRINSEPEITDANGNPYLASDTKHADGTACIGRGEVWVRGAQITAGYYKMPEKTKEDFGSDGWFKTGDIGMVTPDGTIRIVDRKKNLVKLKGGEYVALERINKEHQSASFVDQDAGGVCSYAGHELDRPISIVQVNMSEIQSICKKLGLKPDLKNKDLREHIRKELVAIGKKGGLVSIEAIGGVILVNDPWTTENGCMTASLKQVPKKIYARHKKELEELGASP